MAFKDFTAKMDELQAVKQQSYAPGPIPWANYEAAGLRFGAPYWQAALMRMDEKIHRIKTALERGEVAPEDDCIDVAVLAGKLYEWTRMAGVDSVASHLDFTGLALSGDQPDWATRPVPDGLSPVEMDAWRANPQNHKFRGPQAIGFLCQFLILQDEQCGRPWIEHQSDSDQRTLRAASDLGLA